MVTLCIEHSRPTSGIMLSMCHTLARVQREGGESYDAMLSRLLSASRYLIIIAVVCTLLTATAILVYGGVLTLQIIFDTIIAGKVSSKGAKHLLIAFIELVDLFLLSTVLYIIAVGLYELFVGSLDLPEWLVITDLDMLKDKLVGVVVVVLSVLFLGQAISWDGERDLLGYGAAIALVIATLTYFLNQKPKKKPLAVEEEAGEEDQAAAKKL